MGEEKEPQEDIGEEDIIEEDDGIEDEEIRRYLDKH
jgi:hypothetical protein